MATAEYTPEPVRRDIAAMLTPFFKGWSGDVSEPALPSAPSNRPAPAAARMLEMA